MLFNSISFAIFFIVIFLIYYIIKDKYRWVCLLIGSLYFYGQLVPYFLVFIVISIILTYYCANLVDKCSTKFDNEVLEKEIITNNEKNTIIKKYDILKKIIMLVTYIIMFGILIVFKYYNIFTLKVASFISLPLLNIAMPLGISFYTFTSIGYCIDVYRGEYKHQPNIFKYALFVSYFPHIIQGPISNYGGLSKELYKPKTFDYNKIRSGLYLFAWGFFKKTVIADRLSPFVNLVYGDYISYPNFILILATVLYAIQLYTDFSGYIDMARGVSRCFGVELGINFYRPHFSKTIPEFWRRWHISLGAWFRDYVHYPLLRSSVLTKMSKFLRKKKLKKLSKKLPVIISLLITWVLIGAWHGSNPKYISFSLYHGGLIILSFVFDKQFKKANKTLKINTESFGFKLFRVVRTFILVCIGYIFFRAEGNAEALDIMRRSIIYMPSKMVGLEFLQGCGFDALYFIECSAFILILYTVLTIQRKHDIESFVTRQKTVVRWIIYILIIFIIIVFNKSFGQAASSEFIYFEF